ncbi:unnamed protein product [Spodoptera exigua]|nr:unnamed protein product [Spodoptera exigua]
MDYSTGIKFGDTTFRSPTAKVLYKYKMKTVLLIALLAVTYVYATVDLPEAEFRRPKVNASNLRLILGSKSGSDERLLSRTYHYVEGSHRIAHRQEILIRLVDYARITRVEGWPGNPDLELTVLEGGFGQNFVKLGYNTEENTFFSYTLDVYGVLMKTVLLIALLAVTYVYATVDFSEAEFRRPELNASNLRLILGSKSGSDERLLSRTYHYVEGSHRIAHRQEILIRLVDYARITRVEGWPGNPDLELTVLEGGFGQNFVKLGYVTEENTFFSYTLDVYGVLFMCASHNKHR